MTRSIDFFTVGLSVKKWLKVEVKGSSQVPRPEILRLIREMFQGSSAIALDVKGRMSIPTRHRNAFVEPDGSFVTLTRHHHGCLLMFPRPTWMLKREVLSDLPMSAAPWKRIFLGHAVDVEIDGNGRVLIPPELREAVGLDKNVMLMGMGSHFEIWDEPTLTKKEREAIEAGVPDSIADLKL